MTNGERKKNMNEILKPEFNGEIKANIKSLGEIESNMQEVKEYVIALNDYYKGLQFSEETMKEAKEEKAKVNKFKEKVADYRKSIVAEYNKPIKAFETMAKETENLLTETYKSINEQVENYTNQQKEEKENRIKLYFNEYLSENNIDFVTFEQAKINVTLSASEKSLKEQAKAFIDKIIQDLQLIATQENNAEILVEYKQTLNVSNAITTVVNRQKAIVEEMKKEYTENEVSDVKEVEHEIVKNTELDIENSDFVIVPQENYIKQDPNEFKIVPNKRTINIEITVDDMQLQEVIRFLEISNIDYLTFDI